MIFIRYVRSIMIGLFVAIFCLVCTSTQNVEAQTKQNIGGIDDGIENWTQADRSEIGYIDIGNGKKLGYTFGLASDSYGRVIDGGDPTIVWDSVIPSDDKNNIFRSKINVFLNDNGKYVSSTYQTNYGYDDYPDSKLVDSVSRTSPDFLIVPSYISGPINADPYALLADMTDKEYYVGHDANNNKTFKIVGHFIRQLKESSSWLKPDIDNGVYDLTAEILLRPSPNNSAVVQRELYLHNSTTQSQEFNVLYGEDTMLGPDDGVPIYDLGGRQGLYIQDIDKKYQLMVSNNVPDGFKHYKAENYSIKDLGTDGANNWVKGLNPASVNGVGDERYNYKYGRQLLKSNDTSYILRWGDTSLGPDQTSHFVSTMGVTASGYAIPYPKKNFINETSKDSKNHIGDKLKFSLKMANEGMHSSWLYKQLVDTMPAGLQLDPKSLKLAVDEGSEQTLSDTDYDDQTRTMTIPTNKSLKDGQSVTVTYEATITNDAVKNIDDNDSLINTGDFTGIDNSSTTNANAKDKTYSDAVHIPIEVDDYLPDFKKQVKNLTNGGDYTDKVKARQNDIVKYKITYGVGYGKNYLKSGAKIIDNLPAEIVATNDPVTVTTPDGKTTETDKPEVTLNELHQGESETIEFKAKVTAVLAGQIINTATLNNAEKSDGQPVGDSVSNGAEVDTEDADSFVEVPTKIDFGSTNLYGKTKMIKNISTDGQLIVRHPTVNHFRVSVAYDNDKEKGRLVNKHGDTLPTDDSGLIYIRQRKHDNDEISSWQPVLKDGVSIQSDDFAGNQKLLNLTKLVGINNWQIKVDSHAKTGAYNGKVTWSMVDSVQ